MTGSSIPLQILRLTEAFIYASSSPVTPSALSPLLPDHLDPLDVLEALERHCAGRGVVLFESGGRWTFRTAPDLGIELQRLLSESSRLPRAAMEILVIIALHQPVTRPEIEDIRGVSLSQQTMDSLLEAGLIESIGRKETAGRPTLWATTPLFLSRFGLRSLRDLPGSHLLPAPRPPAPEEFEFAVDVEPAETGDGSTTALDDRDSGLPE
jgi:segregation and condensation protein B